MLDTLRRQKELLESKRAHLLQLEKNIAERGSDIGPVAGTNQATQLPGLRSMKPC